MRSVQYGDRTITYTFEEQPNLKVHYLSVDKDHGAILKGQYLPIDQADRLVLKKARWVLNKLEVVRQETLEDVVTGSRIDYLGRSYYTDVVQNESVLGTQIEFNYSRFRIHTSVGVNIQKDIRTALENFFLQKARAKFAPRVQKWAAKTALSYSDLEIKFIAKKWGICTADNKIILNPNIIRLPVTLVDYIIVHELCHTKFKDHSKSFWAEVGMHLPNWRTLEDELARVKLKL
jgi:predicted metal-dependent hydrolase